MNNIVDNTEITKQLNIAFTSKGSAYKPRTQHFNQDGSPVYINRLILEDSPYLLQHAHNPVNWFPWGSEAFNLAKIEDKPIFISIGYSTCHWCHVMEHESFEDEPIAKYLNEHFISIKVDRENHPDVDATYMTAVTLINGQGGWPMSNFTTTEGKPFFAGAYYNPSQFFQILKLLHEAWVSKRPDICLQADKITADIIKHTSASKTSSTISNITISQAINTTLQNYDSSNGGFGSAPKFPQEPILLFLLEQAKRAYSPQLIERLNHTLTQMAQGGIHDQIGGGFHRYTTDASWQIPHFEKMLYNQALLTQVYIQAYQLTANNYYEYIAKHTLDYIQKEMTAPNGGFFAATDADSEGAEGTFFVWKEPQLKQLLNESDLQLAYTLYDIASNGNFEGANILHCQTTIPKLAKQLQQPSHELLNSITRLNKVLYTERAKRPAPLRDNKIITAWNAMMIKAFAMGSSLSNNNYLQTAINAANCLWEHNQFDNGKLWRIHLNDKSAIHARHEDYAFFADALIAIYDQTEDELWLNRATQVTDRMLELFWDDSEGGFYMAATEADAVCIARLKESSNNTVPAANAVAMMVLNAISQRTGISLYAHKAAATIAAFNNQIAQQPDVYVSFLNAFSQANNGGNNNFGYSANGALKAYCYLSSTNADTLEIDIKLTLKSGWHINFDDCSNNENSHLKVQLMSQPEMLNMNHIKYPEPSIINDEGHQYKIYNNNQSIKIKFNIKGSQSAINTDALIRLKLKFQMCQNKLCQLEESMALAISCASCITNNFE